MCADVIYACERKYSQRLKVLDPTPPPSETELQMVVSHLTGHGTWVLFKGSMTF